MRDSDLSATAHGKLEKDLKDPRWQTEEGNICCGQGLSEGDGVLG